MPYTTDTLRRLTEQAFPPMLAVPITPRGMHLATPDWWTPREAHTWQITRTGTLWGLAVYRDGEWIPFWDAGFETTVYPGESVTHPGGAAMVGV